MLATSCQLNNKDMIQEVPKYHSKIQSKGSLSWGHLVWEKWWGIHDLITNTQDSTLAMALLNVSGSLGFGGLKAMYKSLSYVFVIVSHGT